MSFDVGRCISPLNTFYFQVLYSLHSLVFHLGWWAANPNQFSTHFSPGCTRRVSCFSAGEHSSPQQTQETDGKRWLKPEDLDRLLSGLNASVPTAGVVAIAAVVVLQGPFGSAGAFAMIPPPPPPVPPVPMSPSRPYSSGGLASLKPDCIVNLFHVHNGLLEMPLALPGFWNNGAKRLGSKDTYNVHPTSKQLLSLFHTQHTFHCLKVASVVGTIHHPVVIFDRALWF